jgi:hypothetical protein
MKRRMERDGAPAPELRSAFVRGAVATGLLAAAKDGQPGPAALRAALLGGAALTAGTAADRWIFDRKEKDMGKKKGKKAWKKAGWSPEAAAYAAWNGAPGMPARRGNWPAFLGKRPSDQFLMGALLGAAAAWVLGDEQLRAKLMKGGLQLYSGLLGSVEEMKEQMADIRAELEAGQRSSE